MQQPYEILKSIQLPGLQGVVVSRIYNWLRELNEDIKPSSCFVSEQQDPDFIKFFLDISTKLAESAGVNIVIPKDIVFYFEELARRQRSHFKIYFEKDPQVIESIIKDYCGEIAHYRVADSLRMKSQKTKDKFPQHISIFKAFELSFNLAFDRELPVVLDFSDVRDPDEISSGKDSFIEVCRQIYDFALNPNLFNYLKVLSDICSTIKRGGFRRHGALTSTIISTHELVEEYLNIPFGALSHLKKGISMRTGFDYGLLKLVCQKHSQGELFLEKEFGYSMGKELWTNVCRGLSLIPGDRCLVSPVNLGQAKTFSDIILGFKEVTQFLIDVDTKQRNDGEYLPDKQIAVGMTGLANCLRNFGTDYHQFIEALIVFNQDLYPDHDLMYSPAYEIVNAIFTGCCLASQMGEDVGMRAVLAIEPTASSSRRVKDWKGYDIAPNIDPPNVVPGIGIERRHSETGVFDFEGKKITPEFNYGADIFPAQFLTFEQHFTLWNEMQKLMNSAGKAHFGSYECWGELTTERFFQWWNSDLKTIYYNRTIGTKHLEKGRTINARERVKLNKAELVIESNACLIDDPSCASCD